MIGGDDNFVRQFLVILEEKGGNKERERKYSVKWIVDEQGCEKGTKDGVKN